MQRRTSAPCGCRAAVASAPAKSSRQSRNQSFDGQTLIIDLVQGREPDKETPSEPSVKDLAAFVRDPYNGVFSRRFKIANEEWRANSIGEGTPLGVHSYGQTRWDL